MRYVLAVLLLSTLAAAQNDSAPSLRDSTLPKADQLAIIHTIKRDARNKNVTDDVILSATINSVDLNEDDVPEILAQSEHCSADKCTFWVLQKKPTNYKILLKATAEDFKVRTIKTGGFKDIELGRHESDYRTEWRGYKYDGKRYIRVKCWANVTGDGEHEYPKAKIEPCKKR